jgi:hypothetical protein
LPFVYGHFKIKAGNNFADDFCEVFYFLTFFGGKHDEVQLETSLCSDGLRRSFHVAVCWMLQPTAAASYGRGRR